MVSAEKKGRNEIISGPGHVFEGLDSTVTVERRSIITSLSNAEELAAFVRDLEIPLLQKGPSLGEGYNKLAVVAVATAARVLERVETMNDPALLATRAHIQSAEQEGHRGTGVRQIIKSLLGF